jgi:hypothetical protein
MVTRNSYEETPKKRPSDNADEFPQYIRKLKESGLEVIDTTVPGNAVGFVGGVGKPAKK